MDFNAKSPPRLLKAVADNLPILIYHIDANERLQSLNDTFHSWLGVDLAWAVGRTLQEVLGDAMYAQRHALLQRALLGERIEFETDTVIRGELRHLRTTFIPEIGSNGLVEGVFGLSTDVTDLKKVELELRQLVRIDALTGLPNRRYFDEKLRNAMSRSHRTKNPVALMYLDVDNFKSINDALGHLGGDQVLIEFAGRIKSVLRNADTAARLAGDEFVILLEDLSSPIEVEIVAKKLLAAIRPCMLISGKEISVTASIGIAVHAANAFDTVSLMEQADRALYQAKGMGRDTFVMKPHT